VADLTTFEKRAQLAAGRLVDDAQEAYRAARVKAAETIEQATDEGNRRMVRAVKLVTWIQRRVERRRGRG
jgi:hypothetical protein